METGFYYKDFYYILVKIAQLFVKRHNSKSEAFPNGRKPVTKQNIILYKK